MTSVDINALIPHVQATLVDPHALPTTGDAALAHLAQRRRTGQSLVDSHGLSFYWNADGQRTDAHTDAHAE